MTSSTIHGFPRIGPRREVTAATESHWAGEVSAAELQATARDLRRQVWEGLRDAGLGQIPSNHFSLYDHVLDTIQLVGAIPERFRRDDDELATYFAMARGRADAPAMEMTKWFDTNYHYIVPELGPDTAFRLEAEPKPLAELAEAAALGIRTRPVLLGPVTFLLLGKPAPDAPAGRGGGPSCWSPATSTTSARRSGCSPARRSTAWRWTSPAAATATWSSWPPPAASASGPWSPAWSTGATSGPTTWSARWHALPP